MVELERVYDPVRLSALRAALADAGLDSLVFDTGAGNLWQGAIPTRLMVRAEELELARRAIAQAGLGRR